MTIEYKVNRPSWVTQGMLTAILWAQRSPDPSTQVGACIFDEKNRVIGVGYNGTPRGISPSLIPWEREASSAEKTKYPYIQHAERNAILNSARRDLSDCSIFTTLFPCADCAGMIVQCGISRVYYLEDKYAAAPNTKASKRMLEMADVKIKQVKLNAADVADLLIALNRFTQEG